MTETAGRQRKPRLWLGVPAEKAPWLFYLGFLLVQPLVDLETGVAQWLGLLVLIGTFVIFYGFTHRVLGRRDWFWRNGEAGAYAGLAGIVLIGLVGSLFNTGSSTFFIYAAAVAGEVRPQRRAFGLIGATLAFVVLGFLISPVLLPYRIAPYGFGAIFVPVVGLGVYFGKERDDANQRLRMAQEEVEELATIAERERIARDLHDLLGHTLSTITLKSELAARLIDADPARASEEVRDVERLSRKTLAEVREAVRGYRSTGLHGELVNAKLALEAAGVEFEYSVDRLPLRPEVEGTLTLALREGVTNVVRHAEATRCTVSVRQEGAFVLLRVEDDGHGVGNGIAVRQHGSGLSAMRERVSALGGYVKLTPAEGSGTQLDVGVPVTSALKPRSARPGTARVEAAGTVTAG